MSPYPPHDDAPGAACALLATLIRDGITPPLVPLLRTLPGLAEALPDRYDADEAAAAHYRLWQYNLHPYASLFLTTDGLLGGPATEEALACYRAVGVAPTATHSADHLSTALEVLSVAPLPPTALLRWLLRWLPPLDCAAARQRDPLAGAEIGLGVEIVAEQAERHGVEASDWQLPEARDPLASERSGLREIAAYLATPPQSGLFVSRDEISAIGRQLGTPTGFGSRRDMIEGLLRAAAEFDRWAELLDALRRLLQGDGERLAALPEPLASSAGPWHARLAATQGLLDTLGRAPVEGAG